MNEPSLAAEQFGAAAFAYLTSRVHARGTDLARLAELARSLERPVALDLGCGAGHAGFAIAEAGAQVTAYDLSPEMLGVVEAEAARRRLNKIQTRCGPAESLPFAEATFDLVVSRFSAHHWTDVPAALREARRVLRSRGTLIVIDAVAPEVPLFDTLLQTVEILRDASHVRNYRLSEWHAMLRTAGFASPRHDAWTLTMVFGDWTARMRTSEVRRNAIRDVLARADNSARAHFQIKHDGSFDLGCAWIKTVPADQA